MNYAKILGRCEQLSFQRRDRLPCPADLLIEAFGRRGYNSIAFRAAVEPNRISIVNRKSTTQATIAKRSGQAMVEFAIISFVLTAMLMGFLGLIVMGLGSFQNNIAAESAGRILDGHRVFIKENFASHFNDIGSDDYFDAASKDLQDITARQVYRFLNEYVVDGEVLYDESRLIISREDWDDRRTLGLSAINEALLGQYIFDPDLNAYRFPGAVVDNERTGQKTVVVPLLPKPSDRITIPVIPPPAPQHGIDRSLYVTSTDPGLFYPVSDDWVAPVVIGKVQDGDSSAFRIILFHPSQPASTLNLELERDEQGRITRQTPVEADDQAIDDLIGDPPADYVLSPPTINENVGASSSRGAFGLGESFAFTKKVRPYRLVFETSSLFRIGASLNPIAVKYAYQENGSPALPLANATVQSLNFEQLVIDRSTVDLRRYIIDPSALDGINTHFLRLQLNDDGVWRVSVAVEFEPVGLPWQADHLLQLWLYKNGIRERLIATHNVTSVHSEPVSLTGQSLVRAVAGDSLQARVLTQGGNDVRLSVDADSNWVAFERVGE